MSPGENQHLPVANSHFQETVDGVEGSHTAGGLALAVQWAQSHFLRCKLLNGRGLKPGEMNPSHHGQCAEQK